MIRLILVVLAVVVFTQVETLLSSCTISAQTGCKPCIRPDPDPNKKVENKAPDVTDLTLSTNELTLPCKPGSFPAPDVTVSDSMVVDVAVTAEDPENDILTHNYTVSGGRIIGAGANVKWDLSKVAPGTYTITAGVDDGCGTCRKTQVRTITVASCRPATSDCECPTVSIAGPINDVLSAGENTFTANVSGSIYDMSYEWSVDNGEMVSGQGTPSIRVKFPEISLKSKASIVLTIGGLDPNCACLTERVVEYVNGRRKP